MTRRSLAIVLLSACLMMTTAATAMTTIGYDREIDIAADEVPGELVVDVTATGDAGDPPPESYSSAVNLLIQNGSSWDTYDRVEFSNDSTVRIPIDDPGTYEVNVMATYDWGVDVALSYRADGAIVAAPIDGRPDPTLWLALGAGVVLFLKLL